MSILSFLYTFIITPLELLFEVIFTVANKIIGNAGLSIIFLSLAVNFLVLPLYKRADELQTEERDIQAKMAPHLKHIKNTFKGDERFLIIQEYYRVNHYKPIYALKSSVSLLLQIPFFIAAYNLLSGMQSLQGMKFGFIADLGKEDAMFLIGNFPVNVLPILMTLINIVSGIIYTKGHPLRAKIQVYGLAAIFLILLYHSPAGLVFYWLLNNVFSLVKNIFYKLKDPKKALHILLAVSGAVFFVLTFIKPDLDIRQKLLLATGCILLSLPLISRKIKLKQTNEPVEKNTFAFFAGAIFMAVFTGLLIPSTIINASTTEFINILYPSNPYLYIVNTLLLSFGSWVLWAGIFYFFVNVRMKSVFSKVIWSICAVSVFDYMLFGTDLGNLSSYLQYDTLPSFEIEEYIFNTLVVFCISIVCLFIYSKRSSIVGTVLVIGILTVTGIGIYNSAYILRTFRWYMESTGPSSEMPSIPLSKNGKNVVVLMLDRAMGPYTPYLFNEKPELLEKFDGFTYYPNTISYGNQTLVGSPALYGGYEYTPERINARPDESLASKQNEALLVMPVIFGENGYTVTIFDPSYAGFNMIPDLSIYDDYPDFNCYITHARFSFFEDDLNSTGSLATANRENEIRNRNFFLFSLMKVSPLALQETIYDGGRFNEAISNAPSLDGTINVSALVQTTDGLSKGYGYNKFFLESYPVLDKLPDITVINDSDENTFFIMANDITHSPCLLQEPDYEPALYVDNTAYDIDMESRYTVNGITLPMDTIEQVSHYHVNMAAYIKVGEWFDYLREQGVYDNTRIIIVADHGRNLDQFNVKCGGKDMEYFMPLLMVKDFDATGFTVNEGFMTNGDTPVLATTGLIDNPVNPTTGNPINSELKTGPQTVFLTPVSSVTENNGNTFLPGFWFTFKGGDPHDSTNWEYLGEY